MMIGKYYIFAILSTTCCITFGKESRKSFKRYQIVEVGGVRDVSEDELVSKMNFTYEDEFEVLYRDKIKGTAQVLVKPEIWRRFQDGIKRNRLPYNIIAHDVEKLIQETMVPAADLRSLNGGATFQRYMHLAEIIEFLLATEKNYPGIVKLYTVGKSHRGYDMTLVVISDNSTNSNETQKPIIFIEAGAHAREWISVAAAVYTINQLANSSALTRDVDWHIMPVANPDGYKHTWERNRMWRKNLRQFRTNRRCAGVDLNRNFGVKWGGPGSSRIPCSDVFAGVRAFSEPETQAIMGTFLHHKARIRAFVSIHSYGQYIFIPPASRNFYVPGACIGYMKSLAARMAGAIRSATGAGFTYGSPIQLAYAASGTSMDWAFAAGNAPLVFNFELRDKGMRGFLLPAGEIGPAVYEFWKAMNVLHEEVASKIPSPSSNITQRQAGACNQKRIKTPIREPIKLFFENPGHIGHFDSGSSESSEEFYDDD